MTTKSAIKWTAAIAGGAIAIGIILIFVFLDPAKRSGRERAALLGQGMGLLCAIPIGIVWLKWAVRVRREREAREHQTLEANDRLTENDPE